MSESLGEQLERAIGAAIESEVGKQEGGFVTRWVALVESINADGERGLWTMTSPDVKAWDTIGLLGYATAVQQAQILRGDD